MKTKLVRKKISIKKSSINHYGVFAEENIPANTVIEECYSIMISNDVYPTVQNYVFRGKENRHLAFGYGSIFNHSDKPNASFYVDSENALIVFKSERTISKGEEILISYGEGWFSERNLTPLKPSWKNSIRKNMPLFKKLVRTALVTAVLLIASSHLFSPHHLHINSSDRWTL